MPPTNSQDGNPSTPPQSIPLRDLSRPPDSADIGDGSHRHSRGRSLLSGGSRPPSGDNYGVRYERLGNTSPSPTERNNYRPGALRQLTTQGLTRPAVEEEAETPVSPVGNPADFQSAMGFAGLLVPDISISHAPRTHTPSYGPADFGSPYEDPVDVNSYEGSYFPSDHDRVPLNNPSSLQPISGAQPTTPGGQRHDRTRSSFQSVSFDTPEPWGSRLGDNLADVETGHSPQSRRSRGHSYGNSLSPDSRVRSRSPSNTSALSRAGSIVRAMSQRVVNISGEAEQIEETARREAAQASRDESMRSLGSMGTLGSLSDESETRYVPKRKADPLAAGPYPTAHLPTAPVEKMARFFGGAPPEPEFEEEVEKPPNPFRGNSLGIFSPDSKVRNYLCDVLVYPFTEPIILLLIITQTVLLAVESSQNVYLHPRPTQWGGSPIDWAILALFVVFTFELAARIIVSGFIKNAPEYSTRRHKQGIKAEILDKYQRVFKPQRNLSTKAALHPSLGGQTVLRSFTQVQGESVRTVEQAQRLQLARRAFLRHSFNRLDFVAVLAFWAAFVLGLTGIEDSFHLYVFRMLSCLRILRLLALTNGTAVRSFPGKIISTC